MILQLTAAGRALFDAAPISFTVTRVDFGSSFGYTVLNEPTGLTGSVQYQSNMTISPQVVDANTVKYMIYLAKPVVSFTFGEIALYSGSTLVGVAVNSTAIHKQGPTAGSDGSDLKIETFIDLTPGNRYSLASVDPSGQANSFPRVSVPDLLSPPSKNGNNAYVIYGLTDTDVPYFAFSDPTGKWSFSSKTRVAYTGTINSINALGLQATGLLGSYAGADTDLVLQFTSGKNRGYCRQVINVTETGFQWTTPLATLPAVGDAFIVVSPAETSSGGTGDGQPKIQFYKDSVPVGALGGVTKVIIDGATLDIDLGTGLNTDTVTIKALSLGGPGPAGFVPKSVVFNLESDFSTYNQDGTFNYRHQPYPIADAIFPLVATYTLPSTGPGVLNLPVGIFRLSVKATLSSVGDFLQAEVLRGALTVVPQSSSVVVLDSKPLSQFWHTVHAGTQDLVTDQVTVSSDFYVKVNESTNGQVAIGLSLGSYGFETDSYRYALTVEATHIAEVVESTFLLVENFDVVLEGPLRMDEFLTVAPTNGGTNRQWLPGMSDMSSEVDILGTLYPQGMVVFGGNVRLAHDDPAILVGQYDAILDWVVPVDNYFVDLDVEVPTLPLESDYPVTVSLFARKQPAGVFSGLEFTVQLSFTQDSSWSYREYGAGLVVDGTTGNTFPPKYWGGESFAIRLNVKPGEVDLVINNVLVYTAPYQGSLPSPGQVGFGLSLPANLAFLNSFLVKRIRVGAL